MKAPEKDVVQNHQLEAQVFLKKIIGVFTNLLMCPQRVLKGSMSYRTPQGGIHLISKKVDVAITGSGESLTFKIPMHTIRSITETAKDMGEDDTFGLTFNLESSNDPYNEKMNEFIKSVTKDETKCDKCGYETNVSNVIDTWVVIGGDKFCFVCQKKYKVGYYKKNDQ